MIRTRSGVGNAQALSSRLNERVRFEVLEQSDDGQGGVERQWTFHDECFAEVRPLSFDANEPLDAGQPVVRLAYRITVRARDDIEPTMRVIWRGRVLNIRVVIPNGAGTEIIAQEGVAV